MFFLKGFSKTSTKEYDEALKCYVLALKSAMGTTKKPRPGGPGGDGFRKDVSPQARYCLGHSLLTAYISDTGEVTVNQYRVTAIKT